MQPDLIISQGNTTTTAPPPADTIDELRAAWHAERIQRLEAAHRLERAVFRANADVERAQADAAALELEIEAHDTTINDLRLAWQTALSRAQADAAALREAGKALVRGSWIVPMREWEALAACVYAEHPGDALLAELAAARAEIEQLKETIAHYQADAENNYKLMALYQEQRDGWKEEAERGMGLSNWEEL